MSAPEIRKVPLSVEEWERATRPVNGRGGHQLLLLKIIPLIDPTSHVWTCYPQHLAVARRYANAYGGGGYQDRFRALVAAADRREP